MDTHSNIDEVLTKVPAVTLGFWIIKILATTFGETAGDWFTMTLDFGYLAGTALFGAILVLLVVAQIRARDFQPALYWATIIASTTVGTTLADLATRTGGLGYPLGSLLLLGLVLASLVAWHMALGTISVSSVHEGRTEIFYWITITFSQTLGTALGDWVADSGPGYIGAAIIFGTFLAALALAYRFTALSRVGLFWAAFVLTRPLGAVVGDFLDKPIAKGGLELSRGAASLGLIVAIAALLWLVPQRAGRAVVRADA